MTAARQLFSNGAGVFWKRGVTENKVLVDHLLKTDLTALAEAMEGTVAQSIVDPENPKTALSVRAMLTAHLSALEFLPDTGKPFSIRDWIGKEDGDGFLFLTSRGDQHASLRGLISTWLEIAVNAMLTLAQDDGRRIWVNDPGIAGHARQGPKHAHGRGREVDRARARLAVDDAHLGLVEIDMLPPQGEDFVPPAAGQHQQADSRHRGGGYPAALARDLVQHLPEAGELGVGQEPLPFALGVRRDGLAGIVAVLGRHLPVSGERVHVGQGRDNHVCHRGGLAQALVQRHDVAALHRRERQLAEGRHDVAVDHAAGRPLRLRLAADRDMFLEIARGQVGHRGVAQAVMELDDVLGTDVLHRHASERRNDVLVDGGAVELLGLRLAVDLDVGAHAPRREIGDGGVRLGLGRDGVEAALDAVDDAGRLTAALVERLAGDRSEGHPLQAGGSAGLHDIDLAAVALDAHAEASQIAVPVEGVPAGGRQGGDAADGETKGASLRHDAPPWRFRGNPSVIG